MILSGRWAGWLLVRVRVGRRVRRVLLVLALVLKMLRLRRRGRAVFKSSCMMLVDGVGVMIDQLNCWVRADGVILCPLISCLT